VLVGERAHAFLSFAGEIQLARDRPRAGGLRQVEGIVHFGIGEVVDPVELHDLDHDAGVLILLPHVARRLRIRLQPPLAQLFRRDLAGFSASARDGGRRHAHGELDRLRAHFDGVDAELHGPLQRLVGGHRPGERAAGEVVRDVQADLDAGPLRVRLRLRADDAPRQQARGRHGQHQFSEFAAGIFHRSS
jgi:hypothetical protein